MWVLFAFGSALFAGLTAILAKCGMRGVDSHLATALRTVVVLFFAWALVFFSGTWRQIAAVDGRTLLLLLLSGLATGGSWLCYFKALQMGDVNKVTPVDKSSVILTMLLAFLFFGEPITPWKLVGMALIGLGTWLMLQRAAPTVPSTAAPPAEAATAPKRPGWFLYAAASAVLASLTSILGKAGMAHIDSNLGTAMRTVVVLLMAWAVVFLTGKQGTVRAISRKSWIFLVLSGFATGGSWLCYFRALQTGPASVVVPIDKLSVLLTVLFSRIFLKERLSPRGVVGLVLLTAGTLTLLL